MVAAQGIDSRKFAVHAGATCGDGRAGGAWTAKTSAGKMILPPAGSCVPFTFPRQRVACDAEPRDRKTSRSPFRRNRRFDRHGGVIAGDRAAGDCAERRAALVRRPLLRGKGGGKPQAGIRHYDINKAASQSAAVGASG